MGTQPEPGWTLTPERGNRPGCVPHFPWHSVLCHIFQACLTVPLCPVMAPLSLQGLALGLCASSFLGPLAPVFLQMPGLSVSQLILHAGISHVSSSGWFIQLITLALFVP